MHSKPRLPSKKETPSDTPSPPSRTPSQHLAVPLPAAVRLPPPLPPLPPLPPRAGRRPALPPIGMNGEGGALVHGGMYGGGVAGGGAEMIGSALAQQSAQMERQVLVIL